MNSAEKSRKPDGIVVAAIAAGGVVMIVGIALVAAALSRNVNTTPVTFEVTAVYKGADEAMLKNEVAAPIFAQINGVENLIDMSTNCTSEGACTLTVSFRP